jgi:hypothetical protein
MRRSGMARHQGIVATTAVSTSDQRSGRCPSGLAWSFKFSQLVCASRSCELSMGSSFCCCSPLEWPPVIATSLLRSRRVAPRSHDERPATPPPFPSHARHPLRGFRLRRDGQPQRRTTRAISAPRILDTIQRVCPECLRLALRNQRFSGRIVRQRRFEKPSPRAMLNLDPRSADFS